MFFSRRPVAPLTAFVDTLWASERAAMPHARERNLPTGCVDIVIPLLDGQRITRFTGIDDMAGDSFTSGVVQGAQDRSHQRETHGASAVVGVHFKPGGAAVFFGGALPELRNRTVPLDALWGPCARYLREELQAAIGPQARLRRLESYLMARLQQATPADAVAFAALHVLGQQPAGALIEPVQRASGCSPAQFIARFEQTVGLTPKRYARVLRFHALIERVALRRPDDWAQAAVEAGYADQSHLIHEFKRLAGITPKAYLPIAPDHPTHVAVVEKISNTD